MQPISNPRLDITKNNKKIMSYIKYDKSCPAPAPAAVYVTLRLPPLESGRRLISSIGKTKRIAFFSAKKIFFFKDFFAKK